MSSNNSTTHSNSDTVLDSAEAPSVAFLVGRMNPPTPGHIKLIHEMITFAASKGAVPRAYITQSTNETKMSKAQKQNPIIGLSKTKEEASPEKPYVKHKNYENPLAPDAKKQLIQLMLQNKYNISFEESGPMIVADPKCNGLFRAMGCAREIQPDPAKLHFVMGRELDPAERQSRESFCLNKSDGQLTMQIDDGSKINCHFLARTEDEGISGLSGSKVRLLAAENQLKKLYEVYYGYLSEEQVNGMVNLIHNGINMLPPGSAPPSSLRTPKQSQQQQQGKTRSVRMSSRARASPYTQRTRRGSQATGGKKTRKMQKHSNRNRKQNRKNKTTRKSVNKGKSKKPIRKTHRK